MTKRLGQNVGIRYSQAFKMAVVREVEEQDLPFEQVRRKYGIRSAATVATWVRKFGNGSRGAKIRVEKPEEINEKEQLKRRVRALEQALADANIDLALERQYTRLACERAGIKDVTEFKKRAAGSPPTGP
jgi:transposase-like protein